MAGEIKLFNYEKCCRTCLKEDTIMFDIFMETVESSKNVADILVSSAKLQIHKDDSLPKQICRCCYKSLISFSHFCNMAQKVEEKLTESILSGSELNQHKNNFVINCNRLLLNGYDKLIEFKNEPDDECIIFESHEENFETENHENVMKEQHNSDVSDSDCKSEELTTKPFSKLSKLKQHQEKHVNRNKGKHKLDHASKYIENDVNLKDEANPDFNITKQIHDKKVAESINTVVPRENVNTDILDNDNVCKINNQFQCDNCLLTFKSINSLSAHMRKHMEKGRIISCKECNKVFKKLSHLKRHEIKHEINCPFKCNICTKSFPTEDILDEHVNEHRGIKSHRCPLCGKEFIHMSTLKKHLYIHVHEKLFLCPICGKRFDTSANLKQHQLRHTGLKEFGCKLCPQKFVSKGELTSHTKIHTGERSYTCDQCGATFRKRCALNKHSLRHSGLKPFQCETCLASFTCKDHLKRHHRIHTGEKPYQCDMCERAFSQNSSLVRHRRSHVGEKVYKCSQCPESFRLQADLRLHIAEHFISSQNLRAANCSSQLSTDGAGDKGSPVQSILPPRDGDCSNG